MKTLTQETVRDFEVENYVYLLVDKKMSFDYAKSRIQHFSMDESDRVKALQRLQFAKERIERSLTAEEIATFLFIPFGFFNIFLFGTLFDLRKEKRLGYVNRVQQFYLISVIGVLIYSLIIPGIYFMVA